MIAFKRFTVPVTEKEKEFLLVNFSLDTEPNGVFSSWDRFFRGEVRIEKPWIGVVKPNDGEFSVTRTRTGLFKTSVSMFVIRGKFTAERNTSLLSVSVRPAWHVIPSLIFMFVFFFSVVRYQVSETLALLFLAIALVPNGVSLIVDARKSSEVALEYIEQKINSLRNKQSKEEVV